LSPAAILSPAVPARDCALCPRLKAFREANAVQYPDFFNGPVPSFGPLDAPVLVVGLAPGLKGANRTARPFTGDYAGDLLYPTLITFGLMQGIYGASPDDGLTPLRCRITNAVRCVPPENKPTPAESKTCRNFLIDEIKAMAKLKVIVALGSVAHNSVIAAFAARQAAHPFGHGARHSLPGGLPLIDSYHCSRYNTNTGRLTEAMFHQVFAQVKAELAL